MTVLDLNVPEHQVLVLHLPVLPSTRNDLNCLRHLLRPWLSDPCSQAWRMGADKGTDGSWNISRKSKGRLLWPTKETHCKVKMPWERIFCQQFEPSLKWLLTSAGLEGFLPLLENTQCLEASFMYCQLELNQIQFSIHSKMNSEVETENQQSM